MSGTDIDMMFSILTASTGEALVPVVVAVLGLFALLVALGIGIRYFGKYVGTRDGTMDFADTQIRRSKKLVAQFRNLND